MASSLRTTLTGALTALLITAVGACRLHAQARPAALPDYARSFAAGAGASAAGASVTTQGRVLQFPSASSVARPHARGMVDAPAVALLPASILPAGVLVFDEAAAAQAAERASGGRRLAQVSAGYLGGVLLGFAAWKLLDSPEGADRRVKGDAGYTPNALTAYALGSFVGSTALVYLVGRGDGSNGSLARTMIGTGAPTLVMLLGRHEPYLPILGILLGTPLQAILGSNSYQASRR
jgi:hypothetical protein